MAEDCWSAGMKLKVPNKVVLHPLLPTRQYYNALISAGASDRHFYPIFNKRFDHLETLLTICRPKKILLTGPLCRPLMPRPQSKCPKRTFMLPQKYHVSVSNMLSKSLKCFMENEN